MLTIWAVATGDPISPPACPMEGRTGVFLAIAPAAATLLDGPALAANLGAQLSVRGLDVCTDGGEQTGTKELVALVAVELRGDRIDIEIRDTITDKRVGRDVAVRHLPSHGKALAVAIAIDELLRATWAELILPSPSRDQRIPDALTVVVKNSLPAQAPAIEMSASLASDAWSGGERQGGFDVGVSYALTSHWHLRGTGGWRWGLPVRGGNGTIGMNGFVGGLAASLTGAWSHWVPGAVGGLDWHVLTVRGIADPGSLGHSGTGTGLSGRLGMRWSTDARRWGTFFEIALRGVLRPVKGYDGATQISALSGIGIGASVGASFSP